MAQPPILKAKVSDHPALRDLAEFVVPKAGVRWYNLGLQLFDPRDEGVLDSIEKTHKSPGEQCMEVFKHWLTTKENATWNKLIKSLKSQSVNLPNLAREIKKMLDSRSVLARGTHKITKRLHLKRIPSTIIEGSSSYDSSDAIVENDESDEEILPASPSYSRYTLQRTGSLYCKQTSMPVGMIDCWSGRQIKSQSVSTASLPATLHSMEYNFQQTKSMLEDSTKQLNDYKDMYEKEKERCVEIEGKLSEVNKEKLELENEIVQLKNQSALAFKENPSEEKEFTLTQKLHEELNIRDQKFEKQIKNVTDTFNKQLRDNEEAHRKELLNLQSVDEKFRNEFHNLQVKVEVLERKEIQVLQDIEEAHRNNIGRTSKAFKLTEDKEGVKCTKIATIPRGNLEAHIHTDRISDVLKSETEIQDKSIQTECHEDAVIPQENLGVQPSEASNSKVETEDKEVQVECTETAIVPVPQGKPVQPSETSKSKVQTEDKDVQIECNEITLIPPRDLQDQEVERLKRENSLLISQLTALEEQSFKFTNAFTTADERSVIKLRDLYINMQTNGRPAANRAHRKVYKGISYPILEHTMLAYEEAKELALQEFDIVSGQFNSLFQLKLLDDNPSPDDNPSLIKLDKAMMQSQQLLDSFHTKPLNEKIYQMLIDKYKALTNQAPDGIPQPVDEYYSSLAKFAWNCVARPIPMILSKDTQKFDGDIHETKDGDGDDGDDSNKGRFVSYIYPVLFTSNSWPRQIAVKGKVNVLDSQDSIV